MLSAPSATSRPFRTEPPRMWVASKPKELPTMRVSRSTNTVGSAAEGRLSLVFISMSLSMRMAPASPSSGESSLSRTRTERSASSSWPVASSPLKGLPAKLSRLPLEVWELTRFSPMVKPLNRSTSVRPATRLVELTLGSTSPTVSSSTGPEMREKSPVRRRRLVATLAMTPLKPAFLNVIGVRVVLSSSPTRMEKL